MTRSEEAKKLADNILDFVNCYGSDTKTFAKEIAGGHKTLQQSVMRLFIETIREMAKAPSDERNAQTVELAELISNLAEDYPLPLI